jgi:hypothetical protein
MPVRNIFLVGVVAVVSLQVKPSYALDKAMQLAYKMALADCNDPKTPPQQRIEACDRALRLGTLDSTIDVTNAQNKYILDKLDQVK